MKKIFLVLLTVTLVFTACKKEVEENHVKEATETVILLSDSEIKAEGVNFDSVIVANDIVYYEDGHDYTYGEGGENDSHSKEEADLHRVVHITKAGTYRIKGSLSHGQIAVDLGEDAEDNPEAVVTLILDGIDITSTVAPAVIFYNVFECGDKDNSTKDVDLSGAGARVILEKDSVNTVNGSYVAKIYKPETVVDGNVEDAKKLHKYDAAFYSRMSMTLDGEGTLNINAENEGLDSELHLTINGGNINIKSGNDGINTNEDNVSVTTVNGGVLTIEVTGETGEGDGIDSNGFLVINGGTVITSACAKSQDAGIDSDKGIYINGGTVIAGGSMLDRIEDGGQTFVVFSFTGKEARETLTLKNENGDVIFSHTLPNAFTTLIFSSPSLTEGTYTLWQGDTKLQGMRTSAMGGFNGGRFPSGFERPEGTELPENFPEILEGVEIPEEFKQNTPKDNKELEGDVENLPPSFEKGEFTHPDKIPPEKEFEHLERPDGDKMPEHITLVEMVSSELAIEKGANYFRIQS